MSFSTWRGVVGVIKPTMGPGSLEELIRLLPEGVGVVPLYNDVREGRIEEFSSAIPAYEKMVAVLAAHKVDLIHPEGTPPFMLLGYAGEKKLLGQWQRKFGIPIFTSATNQVRALKAMRIRKFIHIRGTTWDTKGVTARYFADAGLRVHAAVRIQTAWENIGRVSAQTVYGEAKRAFLANPGADGIYVQGSGWRIMDVIEALENDLHVPVIHPVAARCWEIQKRLRIRQPIAGQGRLLAEMP